MSVVSAVSAVWSFFDVCDTDKSLAVCKNCGEKVPRGGHKLRNFNTTNLIRHLRVHHPVEHEEYLKVTSEKKPEKDVSLRQLTQTSISDTKPYDSKSPKAMAITRKMMEFIGLDDQPLSVVQDAGFHRLIKHIDPRYTIPQRKYMTDVALPDLYQTVYAHIGKLVREDATALSFTSDIWSSDVSPISMLSLTAQYLDSDFTLHKVVLHSQDFSGSHTAAALSEAYENMFEKWQIPKAKVHVIVRDNARNMIKAMQDAGLPHLGCLAHTLQLAVHDGVLSQRSIGDMIATGRRIVGHFKHSPLAYSRLMSQQTQLGQKKKRLQQDVSTRWNSTYYMLQSLLEQKRTLGAYGADYELPATFTANQWALIENVLTLLQPFEELTNEISASTATAADVIPKVKALKRFLGKEVASDHGVKTTKSTLLEATTRRFGDIEQEPLYTLATILDPRYKDRMFSEECKTQTRGLLLDLLATQTEHNQGAAAEPPEKVSRQGSLSSMLDELMEEGTPQDQLQVISVAQSQLNVYLSEPPIALEEKPLVYWKNNKNRFPALAPVARAYLSAPCTSVESERLFSAASNIMDERRNRLSSHNAEMLLFIKKNLPLVLGVDKKKPADEEPVDIA